MDLSLFKNMMHNIKRGSNPTAQADILNEERVAIGEAVIVLHPPLP